MKNRLTLFGEFVEGLRVHFASSGEWYPDKRHLVWEITRQESESQASRYMHEHGADRELYSYHKSTISQIIASSYEGDVPDRDLLRRRGRKGYEFVGRRDDGRSVRALESSIEGVMGPRLRDALHKCPLQEDSPFCEKMYRLYDERYGRSELESSDLERYVRSIDGDYSPAKRSEEIYKRLLVAILLGPEAIPAIASVTNTAAMADSALDMTVDGFTLTQLVVRKGEVVPLEAYGFELESDVSIGAPANPLADYSPTFDEGVQPYVSFDHAVICRDGSNGGRQDLKLVNHSTSNGTAVRHADGEVWVTRTRGDAMRLMPGDEIWLAPFTAHGETYPEYGRGAVLRFDYILSHRHRNRPKADVSRSSEADDAISKFGNTPVYVPGEPEDRRERARVGFVLEDLNLGLGGTTYRYENLADDEGYFSLSLGRQGDYATGGFLGSAVARQHADIEPMQGSDLVMITNKSSNEVVVRHVGGSFDELGAWQYVALSDGDEIYLAGFASDSTAYAASNGSVIRFGYMYRIGAGVKGQQ